MKRKKAIQRQPSMFDDDYQGAVFSPCRTWRYTLWRTWNPDGRKIMFLMLNPSTADENTEDNTVTRTIDYAQQWGFGQIAVCNIFAYRSTAPEKMLEYPEPIGPENDRYILQIAAESDMILTAWGRHGSHMNRSTQVVRMLERHNHRMHYLTLTKQGEPGHPLYLSKELKPQPLIEHKGLLQTDIETQQKR